MPERLIEAVDEKKKAVIRKRAKTGAGVKKATGKVGAKKKTTTAVAKKMDAGEFSCLPFPLLLFSFPPLPGRELFALEAEHQKQGLVLTCSWVQ